MKSTSETEVTAPKGGTVNKSAVKNHKPMGGCRPSGPIQAGSPM